MRRLRDLSIRTITRQKGRVLLTSAGIMFGVAMVFGSLVASSTVTATFAKRVESVTGRASVSVTSSGATGSGIPTSTVDTVAELPGVELAVPLAGTQSSVETLGGDGRDPGRSSDFVLLGLDVERATEMYELSVSDGGYLDGAPGQILLSETLAERTGLTVGDRTRLFPLFGGERPIEVAGIVGPGGLGSTNNGVVAFAPLVTVQDASLGRDLVSRVDVALDPGVDPDTWIEAFGTEAGAGTRVESTASRGAFLGEFVGSINASFAGLSAVALFLGAMLIYLTFSTAVAERTTLYGTLRALGADRSQVLRLVLAEGLVQGAIATVVGIVVGGAVGVSMVALVSLSLKLGAPVVAVPSYALPAAVFTGIGVTAVATLLPARTAARLSPVAAMKGLNRGVGTLSKSWIVGVALQGFGVAVFSFADKTDLGVLIVCMLSLLIGAVLTVPLALGPAAGMVGRVTARLSPGVGRIGVMHLVKERSRSAFTLGLLMCVLAALVTIGSIDNSISYALDKTLGDQFGADVQVYAEFSGGPRPATEGRHLREDLAEQVAELPGVVQVSEEWVATAAVTRASGPEALIVRLLDPQATAALSRFQWIDGDDATIRARLARGRAIALPENEATRLGLTSGDHVDVQTGSGIVDFEIAGVFTSIGVIALGAAVDGPKYFRTGAPDALLVDVEPGVPSERIAEQLRAIFLYDQPDAFVFTGEALKNQTLNQIASMFSLFYAVMAVAGIVGMLGLANTLVISVLERTREIGILRSMGTQRRQMLGMIGVEALTLTVVALILAIPLGSVMAIMMVGNATAGLGFKVDILYPWSILPVLGIMAALVAGFAAVGPARRAGRIEPVQAMRFE